LGFGELLDKNQSHISRLDGDPLVVVHEWANVLRYEGRGG
jgi:hypothetical protein